MNALATRREGLVEESIGKDRIVIDVQGNQVHHLNRTMSAVWDCCDGRQELPDAIRAVSESLGQAVDNETVLVAIIKLHDAGLIVRHVPLAPDIDHARRQFVAKAALRVAASVAVPSLVTAVVPTPAAAMSGSEPMLNPAPPAPVPPYPPYAPPPDIPPPPMPPIDIPLPPINFPPDPPPPPDKLPPIK